ncbi:MAG: hypothetical protein ACYTGX_08540 [Planctomycetota bacterium]
MATAAVTIMALGGCGKTEFGSDPAPTPPPLDTTAPDDVTNFTATPGPNAGEVTLDWTPSISPDAIGYNITVTPQGGSPAPEPQVTPASANTYVVTGLTSGLSHDFLIQTEDSSGNVSTGVTVTALPGVMQDPINVTAVPGNNSVTLNWTNAPAPPAVANYVVTIVTPTGVTPGSVTVTPGGGGTTSVTLGVGGIATGPTTLANGVAHTFRVQSADTNNNFSPGVLVSATPTPTPDTTPPVDSTTITAVPSNQQVDVYWGPATDNIGVASYTVTATDLTQVPPVVVFTQAGLPTTVITSGPFQGLVTATFGPGTTPATTLSNGVAYRFTVTAVDFAGNVSTGIFVDATPGNPNVQTTPDFVGGPYRNSATVPTITLTGQVNGGAATGGVIFYTVDGTNPIVSSAVAPNASGVQDSTGNSNGVTFVQANPTPTGLNLQTALTQTIYSGTTTSASGSTTQVNDSNLPPSGIRTGDTITFTSGANNGQTRTIANNGVGATTLTVTAGFGSNPGSGDTYVVQRTLRAVTVKYFYDPLGTVGPPATTSAQAGATLTARYFSYNNNADTFTAFGGMLSSRTGHTATLITQGPQAGGVFMYGGEAGGTNVDSIFDPSTEFFFSIGTPFPSGGSPTRRDHMAVRLDNTTEDIVVIGGRSLGTGSFGPQLNGGAARSAERYNPVANTFNDADGGNFTARAVGTATVITARTGGASPNANDVFVAGGMSVTNGAGATFLAMASSGQGSVLVPSTYGTLINIGDVLEVSIAGSLERAVVVNKSLPPLGVGQVCTVSPSFSTPVALLTLTHFTVNATGTQLYNPNTNAWAAGPNLPHARWGHSAVLLQNGMVFIAGGHLEAPVSSTNDQEKTTLLYDPSSGTMRFAGTNNTSPFTSNSALLTAQKFFAAADLMKDGKVLICGGLSSGVGHFKNGGYLGSAVLSSADVFDPTNETTVAVGNMGLVRAYHRATTLNDGRVLITGGADLINTGGFLNTTILSAQAELFDPLTRSFGPTGTMLVTRAQHAATVLPDGRVLITGGGTALPEVYDPATGLFNATAGTATANRQHGGALIGLPSGNLLAAGGQEGNQFASGSQVAGPGGVLAHAEVYDVNLSQFVPTAGMSDARRFHTLTLLDDGRVMALGGEGAPAAGAAEVDGNSVSALGSAELFDETTGAWTSANPMGTPRFGQTTTKLAPTTSHTAGTAVFNGTTTVFGTNTFWSTDGVQAGDRIRLDSDGTYFEVASVVSDTQLTLVGPIGGFFPSASIPTGAITGPITATGGTTTTITGAPTSINIGDRIRITVSGGGPAVNEEAQVTNNDGSGTITLGTALTAAPTGTTQYNVIQQGAYTVYSVNKYTIGTATFTSGSNQVTGPAGLARVVQPGDLIRPTGAGLPTTVYTVLSVTAGAPATITLSAGYTGPTTVAGPPATLTGPYEVYTPGKLLAVGGGPAGSPLNSGETWDVVSGNWTSVTNTMSQGRFGHSASLLPNGFVLIVGGNNNFDRTAELYDPAMDRFTRMSLPIIGTAVTAAARNNHTGTAMPDGNVVIAGGDVAQAAVELFRTDSDGNAANDADGDGFAGMDFTNTTFTLFTNTMNNGRVLHTAIVLPGAPNRLLLAGGKDNTGGSLDADVLSYTASPGGDTFATVNFPAGRSGYSSHSGSFVVANGIVYLLDGHLVLAYFTN